MEPMTLHFTLDDGTDCELILNRIFQAENGQSYAVLYLPMDEMDEYEYWENFEDTDDLGCILLRAIPKPLEAGMEPVDGEHPETDYALESIADEQEYKYAYDAFTKILLEEVDAEIASTEFECNSDTEIDGEKYRIVDIFAARNRDYCALVKHTELDLDDDEKQFFLYCYDEIYHDDGQYTEIKVSPITASMEYAEVEAVFKRRIQDALAEFQMY